MKKIIIVLLLLGVNLSSIRVLGDHYDITTMYKFNTEETYLDGEVITRYLNTCTVSVHPQTNAIGLPYMDMNMDGKINYPLKSPAVPPLSFPLESTEWKTLTSSGVEDLLLHKSSLSVDYLSLFRNNFFFTWIENDSQNMEEVNMFQQIYLLVQIKKGYLISRIMEFTLQIGSSARFIKVKIQHNSRVFISLHDDGTTSSCNSFDLQTDDENQVLFYMNLKGHPKIYDAIGHDTYDTIGCIPNLDFDKYTSFSSNRYYDNCGAVCSRIAYKFIPEVLSDSISIVSPLLDFKNMTTLVMAFVRKPGAKLVTSLIEEGTDKFVQLESEDLIKLTTNQSDEYEAVVSKLTLTFPEDWTKKKQINIKPDKNAYIINIWEGGNTEFYQIYKNVTCIKFNKEEVYDVVFQYPKASKNVIACINGGIYDGLNRMCSCPPGFTGDSCEIACGKNLFGQTCSKMCSNTEAECMGMILCTPSYGCACAPGYHGEQCSRECKEGTYGADCTQTCGRCKGGCDRYTGVCRECKSPYLIWPACKQSHSYWEGSPVVEESTYTSIKLSLDFNLKNIRKSPDVTKFYFIQYKENSDSLWINSPYNAFSEVKKSHVIRNLNPGRRYLFRVFLVDESFSTNDPELSEICIGTTKCTVSKIDNNMNITQVTNTSVSLTWKKETTNIDNECPFSSYTLEINEEIDNSEVTRKIFNITGNAIVVKKLTPDYPYNLKLRKNTIYGESFPVSSIKFRTHKTQKTTDNLMSVLGVITKTLGSDVHLQWFKMPLYTIYYIKYRLSRLISCSQDKIESTWKVVPTSAINHTLHLEPNAQYEIFLTIDPTQETSVHKLTQITDGELPNIAPTLLEHKFRVTNESAQIYWTDPTASCNHMNGFFHNYVVQLLDFHETLLNTYETLDRKLEITSLSPNMDYKLRIRYVNHIGESQIYTECTFKTKTTFFTTAEDLTAYKTSANSIGLRWKCSDSNSTIITGITVNVQNQAESMSLNITDLKTLQCKAWPSYVCYIISNLKQNTKYTVSVDIFSKEFPEGVLQKSIQAVTRETAPSPVNDIKVEDISNTNMTISWRIPFLLNGILKKFLIEVEHLSSFDETLCCQSITTITLVVNEENEIYSHVIENIQNASSYQITVRASTKRLGQETSKIIDTAPRLIPIELIPEIQVGGLGGGKVIIWQESQVTNLSSEKELITDLLIIVESNENNNKTKESSVLMKELGHCLSNNWWLAHVCPVSEDCSLNIGTGEESDSPYGKVRNSPLTVGHKYTVVLAQVNKYLSARSFTIAKSAQFEMESTSLIMSTIETTTQSSEKYNSSELFYSTHLIPETTIVEVEST